MNAAITHETIPGIAIFMAIIAVPDHTRNPAANAILIFENNLERRAARIAVTGCIIVCSFHPTVIVIPRGCSPISFNTILGDNQGLPKTKGSSTNAQIFFPLMEKETRVSLVIVHTPLCFSDF
jgi:hypothetical protein